MAEQHAHIPLHDAVRELRVLPSQLAFIEERFGLTSPEEVRQFLLDHPQLVPLLREASEVMKVYFGQETRVTLSIREDPEIPHQKGLVASIQTAESADRALAQLRQFDEAWWLDAAEQADDNLVISLEPV